MKMLRIAAGLALSACFAMLVACNSLPTVQQQFQTGCTIVNGDLAIIAASPLLNAEQQSAITNTILPANQAICKAGGTLNVTDLKLFHDSLLPAAIAIVQGVPALPNQPAILLGLQTFGPMVQALVDQLIATAVPASAPVAASQ
ncbi:hypothetical protein LMG22037_05617 [Paraburkholderia phenoliruptrix]|uniref:Phage lipoprotein n=1 Tax=Paraburkholderia phenoliruptrix TaxID=252970 RepID=A0A6J5CB14_9BURK|nr:hypothetical protein [Paraburkholderia phenoliruptrix]CAB3731479.1 hypothetical protein LMG22037_05617 [Paraburkholderia phenoliruptrix]